MTQTKDSAIWVTWYDLPEAVREEHLAWVHRTYAPKILERTGLSWAAHYACEKKTVHAHPYPGRFATDIPGGGEYLLLFGAEDAHAFARPVPRKLHASLPEEDQARLRERASARSGIFIEQARADGPDAGTRDPAAALSPCIQLGSLNLKAYDDEEEMLDWYANWRMPSMQKLPGCVGIRKLVSVTGWAKHGALYEFASIEARNRNFLGYESAYPQMDAWSNSLIPRTVHAPGSAHVGRRIWSAVK
jgi:hypothetical protein